MKKAQWKETPRDRAYGVPRHSDIEKLNMQVADLMARLNLQLQKTEMWQSRVEHLKERYKEAQGRINELRMHSNAYKFLRAAGVVMEHEEEFKHLKGEDMDSFFGMDAVEPEPVPEPVPEPSQGLLQDHVLQSLNAQFEKAYWQYVTTGAGATKIYYDDHLDALPWQAPQKCS